jgi:hypothetical protein
MTETSEKCSAGPSKAESQAWEVRTRDLLDASTSEIDFATLSKLNQIRQQALAAPKPRPKFWLFGGLAATAVALAFAVSLHINAQQDIVSLEQLAVEALGAPLQDADAEVSWLLAEELASQPDAELDMVENLEFYLWLQTQSLQG